MVCKQKKATWTNFSCGHKVFCRDCRGEQENVSMWKVCRGPVMDILPHNDWLLRETGGNYHTQFFFFFFFFVETTILIRFMDFPFSLLTFLLLSLPTIDLWEVREKKLAPPIFDVHFGTDNFSVAHLFVTFTCKNLHDHRSRDSKSLLRQTSPESREWI